MAFTVVPRDRMLLDPVGNATVGPHHAMWCVDADLTGVSLWGEPTSAEVTALFALLAAPHSEALNLPCDVVLDGRYLRGMNVEAFEVFVEHARHHHSTIAARTRRQALVRPEGAVGALFSGFNALLAPEYRWGVFARLDEALAWLERDDAQQASQAVTDVVNRGQQASPLVISLEAWLRSRRDRVAVSDAAKALAVSVRSLQRHLAEHGTSFRDMAAEVAVERAEALLTESELKIANIADSAGNTSRETLVRRFRRRRGVTPSEWRRRSRTS
jgi:AraC-like DNA-binding protein